MPTIDRQAGFFFYFFSGDLAERPHVHVGEGKKTRGDDAKIWLDTLVIERPGRFNQHKIRRALKIVEENQALYLRKWKDYAENR